MAPRPRVCPTKPLLSALDVSRFQGRPNWKRVALAKAPLPPAGREAADRRFRFAIARASTGRSVDSQFARNWPAIRNVDMVRGAYVGFHPLRTPAVHVQALLRALGDDFTDRDAPPVIDVEKLEDVRPPMGTGPEDVDALLDRAEELVELVKRKLGRVPWIYTGAFWQFQVAAVRPKRAGELAALGCPLWTPHYEVPCPGVARGWRRWLMWQWTSHGRVDGIVGGVDLDWFHGTELDLSAAIRASIVVPGIVNRHVRG